MSDTTQDGLRETTLYDNYILYEDGRIYSKKTKKYKKTSLVEGYPRITLWQNSISHQLLLHRLLAIAFIPNPDKKIQVNHIDGNRQNYALSNLEWVTPSENQLHSYRVLGNITHNKGKISPHMLKKCEYCGKTFHARMYFRRFCSNTCSARGVAKSKLLIKEQEKQNYAKQ